MSAAVWIAAIGLALTVLLNAVGFAVAYGILKGSVAALAERVKALESEIGAIGEIKTQVAVVTSQLTNMSEQLKDLNANLRWMRSDNVPGYDAPAGVTPPRPRARK